MLFNYDAGLSIFIHHCIFNSDHHLPYLEMLGRRHRLSLTNCIFSLLQLCKQFVEAGFMADADLDSGCLLNKKIRNAQLAQYNFILGEK